MDMPKAYAFVNCLNSAGYVTVRNNYGCVNNELVLAESDETKINKDVLDEKALDIMKVRNLIIDGNILRYQKYTEDDVPNGMLILKGFNVANLALINNWIEGSLWSVQLRDINTQITGILRIENNESIGSPLFITDKNLVIPDNIITFFSGNVSNGKKTDIGDFNQQTSKYDGLNFKGRYFFNTDQYKQCVYLNDVWYYSFKYT